jgi:hypothetical protein
MKLNSVMLIVSIAPSCCRNFVASPAVRGAPRSRILRGAQRLSERTSRGDMAYNLALSQRRAETVKQELIRLRIARNRIVFATGWGELHPNCLELTEECWKQNRRVDFLRANE